MQKNTVGIQLRDYRPEFPNYQPQYGRDFLEKAMEHFPEDFVFVVSSNRINFAKECIPKKYKNVVFLEGERDYIDMYLLSFCKHNVISNSTFGWWAAYMNKNRNKIVLYPDFWWESLPCQDICPDEWIGIESETEGAYQ